MPSTDSPLWRNLVPTLPMFAVWTTGIVLAIRMRRRQPGAALAAAIAFATFMLLAVINLAFIAWGSSREGSEDEYYHSVFVAKNILIPIATAGAWIVFLCALFGWRDSAPTPVQATRVSREVVFGTFAGACVGAESRQPNRAQRNTI